jgi:hypothetical protein
MQVPVFATPPLLVAHATAEPYVVVLQAFELRLLERLGLDEEALALIALAGSAEAYDHGGQAARSLRPAGERGIAAWQEDEVAEVGAVHAERPLTLHDEKVVAPRALRAGEVADGGDDHQLGRARLRLGEATPFGLRQAGETQWVR